MQLKFGPSFWLFLVLVGCLRSIFHTKTNRKCYGYHTSTNYKISQINGTDIFTHIKCIHVFVIIQHQYAFRGPKNMAVTSAQSACLVSSARRGQCWEFVHPARKRYDHTLQAQNGCPDRRRDFGLDIIMVDL